MANQWQIKVCPIKHFKADIWGMKIFTEKLTLNKSTFKTNDFLMIFEISYRLVVKSYFLLWSLDIP